ncbi:MAG: hypothetical protein MK188_11140 [Gammaproteobacteria bacterium]|nr:hypothetical protein [Gammaproteobacteria bacterium]
MTQGFITSVIKEPLVHFTVGAVVILAYFEFTSNYGANFDAEILIAKEEVEQIVSQWEKRWHRPPSEQELEDEIAQIVEQELLFREGKRLGLDQNDLFVRNRVIQKVKYLIDASIKEPSEKDLQQWLVLNRDLYRSESKVYFEQFLVDRSQVKQGDYQSLLSALNKNQFPASAIERSIEGVPRLVTNMELTAVSSIFGDQFTEQLTKIEQSDQDWHGPIFGGYGVHFVRSLKIKQPENIGLENQQVRRAVVNDWIANQKTKVREKKLLELANRIDIKIER